MRRGYDSVTTTDLPGGGDVYLAYIDGAYANLDAVRRRFPHATIITVTVTGRAGAHCCDQEKGDLTPAGAVAWAQREIAAGRHPIIYTEASTWGTCKTLARKAGLRRKVQWYIADYDGVATIPRGAIGKQYRDPHTSGGHFDVSVFADHIAGVDPDIKPVPKPKPRKATRLWGPTRVAIGIVTRNLNRRPDTRPLDLRDRPLLELARHAIERVEGLK